MQNFSLYYPDVFRFKTTFEDERMDFRVDYQNVDELESNDIKGILLQSILLYDTIFIHSWDLPVLAHFFNGRENAEYLFGNNIIRVINSDDKVLGCMKSEQSYSLAGASFVRGEFNNEDEVNFMLQSFRGNYNDYKEISKSIIKNRIDINTDDMFHTIENELYLDITNQDFRNKHRITTNEFISITPLDVKFLNSRLEAYRRIYFAQKGNIKDIYAEDVLIETIKEKLFLSAHDEHKKIDVNDEFNKLTKVIKIPNVVEAVKNDLLTTKDILKIREHKHCIELMNWLHSNAYFQLSEKDNLDVITAYQEALGKKGLLEKLPVKVLRFAVTGALGFIPGVSTGVELGVSALDTFLLDKFKIGEWRPQLFFNQYRKLLKEGR